MSREWRPGDVARIEVSDDGAVGIWTGDFWAWSNGDGPYSGVSHCHRDVSARPLVVIDPGDREQVERLGKAIYDNGFTAAGRLADALREFADPTPPKCGAALNLAGEHYGCDRETEHEGPHGNRGAAAIWESA